MSWNKGQAIPRDGFRADCTRCPRLATFLAAVREREPAYHAAPVPPFGDPAARLLVVGLAPGMHGANRTGRPFTGDYAGELLYSTLHAFGYGSRPVSEHAADGLLLADCRITNAVKCLPPQNKPTTAEVNTCNAYLRAELEQLQAGAVVIALGLVAHRAVLRAEGERLSAFPFGHGREHALGRDRWLIDSYHCSRYNTNTRRLTPDMFHAVFRAAQRRLGG